MSIKENLEKIKNNIKNAALRAGRDPNEVLLLAVSKTISADVIKEAISCGVCDLGENRVQELTEKYEVLGSGLNWHLIGHLQTNKVKYIIDKVCLIHSVESVKLAEEINKKSKEKGIVSDILVEVNIGEEASKFGVSPDETEMFIKEISHLENIRIRGLMTVAPFTDNAEDNREYFRKMKDLFVDINNKRIDNVNMDTLSMGMTGDYEVAVEEGATIVRVGTGIFGERY